MRAAIIPPWWTVSRTHHAETQVCLRCPAVGGASASSPPPENDISELQLLLPKKLLSGVSSRPDNSLYLAKKSWGFLAVCQLKEVVSEKSFLTLQLKTHVNVWVRTCVTTSANPIQSMSGGSGRWGGACAFAQTHTHTHTLLLITGPLK